MLPSNPNAHLGKGDIGPLSSTPEPFYFLQTESFFSLCKLYSSSIQCQYTYLLRPGQTFLCGIPLPYLRSSPLCQASETERQGPPSGLQCLNPAGFPATLLSRWWQPTKELVASFLVGVASFTCPVLRARVEYRPGLFLWLLKLTSHGVESRERQTWERRRSLWNL